MEQNPAVVIDNGSGMIKAGIAGEDAPKAYFPSVVGLPRFEKIHGADEKDFYVGHEAIKKRGLLALEYPIEDGNIKNWEHMRKIWHHCYYSELKVDPSDQPVLITEPPLNSKENKENMMEIFFENFKVPAFYVYTQAVLALYADGRTTGLVVDSGEGATHIVVVYDGYSIQQAVRRMDLAGKKITDYVQKNLVEDGYNIKSTAEREVAREVKEQMSYVSLDYETDLKAFDENRIKRKDFELPDGKKINLGNLMIRAPECLFKPKLLGIDIPGIHKEIDQTIMAAEPELRRELYDNITLTGGSTMFMGFRERLSNELGALTSSMNRVKIIAPPELKFSSWIGGSILTTLPTFQSSWITQAEFAEAGKSIVHRKCV